jgi:hypothetical protein
LYSGPGLTQERESNGENKGQKGQGGDMRERKEGKIGTLLQNWEGIEGEGRTNKKA